MWIIDWNEFVEKNNNCVCCAYQRCAVRLCIKAWQIICYDTEEGALWRNEILRISIKTHCIDMRCNHFGIVAAPIFAHCRYLPIVGNPWNCLCHQLRKTSCHFSILFLFLSLYRSHSSLLPSLSLSSLSLYFSRCLFITLELACSGSS